MNGWEAGDYVQADRHTQTNTQAHRPTDRESDREIDTLTHTHRQTDTDTHTQANRQTERKDYPKCDSKKLCSLRWQSVRVCETDSTRLTPHTQILNTNSTTTTPVYLKLSLSKCIRSKEPSWCSNLT